MIQSNNVHRPATLQRRHTYVCLQKYPIMLLNMLQARANNMKKTPWDLTAESVEEVDDSMLP